MVSKETPQPFRKKRVRLDLTVENEELKLKISEELTPWLVDDWDLDQQTTCNYFIFFPRRMWIPFWRLCMF